jgi:hypothetical protein
MNYSSMKGTKIKIAIGLCFFLTITPFIGPYFWAESKLGKFIGHFMPYIHLTMPQLGGLPFAETIGVLFGLIIFFIGLIGFIIFIATKFKNLDGLLFLLFITIIYCGFRAFGGII